MTGTTPNAITDQILELCKKIDSTQTPRFLPLQDSNGHKLNDCFNNVRRKVERDGGGIQHGWIIWEIPNVLLEGIFHAVWINHAAEFMDITPKAEREAQILFLPDSKRVWQKCHVPNVRVVLTKDPAIIAEFERQQKLDDLMVKYNVDGEESRIPASELRKLFGIKAQDMNLQFDELGRKVKVGRNDQCPCGSGEKFKKCCGK